MINIILTAFIRTAMIFGSPILVWLLWTTLKEFVVEVLKEVE